MSKGRQRDFYKSKQWKDCRSSYMKFRMGLCERCLEQGVYTPAEIVHHKIHIDLDTIDNPMVLLDWDNLQAVCRKCHAELHPEINRKDHESDRYVIDEYGRVHSKEDRAMSEYMVTLVCGLPGTGKSTYTKEHLGSGLAFDLDALAAAFRLRTPHEEYDSYSRSMADDLLDWFLEKAPAYTSRIYVIRTAPSREEFNRIHPDRVVICRTEYTRRNTSDAKEIINRIVDIESLCKRQEVPVEYA